MRQFGLLIFALGLVVSCQDDNTASNAISCQYEVGKTGCGGGSFGAFDSRCATIDDPRDGYSADQFCDSFRGTDTSCAGGCCVNFKFRNAMAFNLTYV